MNGNNLYDLIQTQVFTFPDNIIGGNRIPQINAVTTCVLAESIDISGKAGIVKQA